MGDVKVAQWLRACTAFVEDLSSVPSTQCQVAHNSLLTPVLRGSDVSVPPWAQHLYIPTQRFLLGNDIFKGRGFSLAFDEALLRFSI